MRKGCTGVNPRSTLGNDPGVAMSLTIRSPNASSQARTSRAANTGLVDIVDDPDCNLTSGVVIVGVIHLNRTYGCKKIPRGLRQRRQRSPRRPRAPATRMEGDPEAAVRPSACCVAVPIGPAARVDSRAAAVAEDGLVSSVVPHVPLLVPVPVGLGVAPAAGVEANTVACSELERPEPVDVTGGVSARSGAVDV